MQVRFEMSLGLPIAVEDSAELVGLLEGILIHPDTAKVEGFFVAVPSGFLSSQTRFLSSYDIIRWTTHVVVRSRDVLCDTDDVIRLQPLMADPRTILGQRIQTES